MIRVEFTLLFLAAEEPAERELATLSAFGLVYLEFAAVLLAAVLDVPAVLVSGELFRTLEEVLPTPLVPLVVSEEVRALYLELEDLWP